MKKQFTLAEFPQEDFYFYDGVTDMNALDVQINLEFIGI